MYPQVRRKRQAVGVRPYVKQVDTLAAEFPASTNYLYMTYSGNEDDIEKEEMVRLHHSRPDTDTSRRKKPSLRPVAVWCWFVFVFPRDLGAAPSCGDDLGLPPSR